MFASRWSTNVGFSFKHKIHKNSSMLTKLASAVLLTNKDAFQQDVHRPPIDCSSCMYHGRGEDGRSMTFPFWGWQSWPGGVVVLASGGGPGQEGWWSWPVEVVLARRGGGPGQWRWSWPSGGGGDLPPT